MVLPIENSAAAKQILSKQSHLNRASGLLCNYKGVQIKETQGVLLKITQQPYWISVFGSNR